MKLIAVLNDRSGATADCSAGLNGSEACTRIESVKDGKTADMEQQHGDRIGEPALLAFLVDAADARRSRASTGRSTGDRKVRSPLKTRVI